ncbi:MAG TPA: twin-arginine translocation signal domain-containing protein, partial [Gemmatimonadales bacterium]
MCKPCDEGKPQDNTASLYGSRRDFLKASTATAVAAAGMNFLSASPATAQPGLGPPEDSGAPRRRYVIRGGYVMSMDPAVGDFAPGDVLVEGTKILAVGPNLKPGHGAGVIDATGRIVMPGFIDTHHHQFE